MGANKVIFVPFLGDFLSIVSSTPENTAGQQIFVPFLGDFLSIDESLR